MKEEARSPGPNLVNLARQDEGEVATLMGARGVGLVYRRRMKAYKV